MNIGTIILAVLMFSLLIFIHELGHFLTAKWSGIKVNEFAIGMGPKLLSWQKGETVYSIRAFPIGGFCAMEGENEESGESGAFCNAKLSRRILVTVAGSLMNLLLGLILVGVLSTQMSGFGTTVIAKFSDTATSNQALQAGDEITRINGHRVRTSNDIQYELQRDRDGVMDIEVVREGETRTLAGVTFKMEEIEGVKMITQDFWVVGVAPTVSGVLKNTFNLTGSLIKHVWGSFVDLITGRYGLNALSGPVGVTGAIGQAASQGWRDLVLLMSVITLNLGVFNLLPVPALDGGRLVFLLIELIRRKPINPKYEGAVTVAGFVLLIGLMIVVTVKDVITLAV